MGRPSKYTDALAASICDQIAEGRSLRSICEGRGVPSRQTIRIWLRERDGFRCQYARAREDQADIYAEQVVEIADEATPQEAHVAKLRVDARKWAAGKLRPKVYGDRMNLGGTDDPIKFAGADSDEALASRVAGLARTRRKNGDTRKANGNGAAPPDGVGV